MLTSAQRQLPMDNPTAISFPLRRERLRKAALPVRLSCLGDTFPYPLCVISWHIKVASAARLVALIQRWIVLLYKQKGQFSLPFSPREEEKCVRGPSGRGARRLARAGVLDPYIEHGKQALRRKSEVMAVVSRASPVSDYVKQQAGSRVDPHGRNQQLSEQSVRPASA